MHGKTGFASRFLAIPLDNLDGTSKLTRGIVILCRMQKLKSVAALGEELGGNEAKWKTTIFRKWCEALSSRSLAAARLPKAQSSSKVSSDPFDQ